MRLLSDLHTALSTFVIRRLGKRPGQLAAELFVAVALALTFFQLVRPACLPHPNGNDVSFLTFVYLNDQANPTARDQVMLAWKKRLAGPALSAWLVAATHRGQTHITINACENLFGIYHAGWLFLLFLALIYYRRDALLVMLGVFAGLMYNMTDYQHGWCYYPWDMPNMFFFTLACLWYDARKIGLFLAACCVGGLFKETSLFCVILIFFYRDWTWAKRLAGFAGTVAACYAINKMMLAHYGITLAPVFAMNNTTNGFDQVFNNAIPENLWHLFSLEPHHVLFTNAGALLIVLLLPWRNYRDVTFKTLLLLFVIGEYCYGMTLEARIWYEILPLGWMLVSEAMTGVFSLNPPTALPAPGGQAFHSKSYWVLLATLMAAALVYTSLHAPFQPVVAEVASAPAAASVTSPVPPLETNVTVLAAQSAELGRLYVSSETALAWRLQQQGQDLDSARHLRQALALGTDPVAASNFAWLLTISTNSAVRNGPEAVRWAEAACAETGYTNAMIMGIMAAAYAEGHRFNDAVAAAQKAHDLSLTAGETAIAARYEELRKRYQSGQTYR